MVSIRIKSIKGKEYAYCRKRDRDGKLVERYLGPIERSPNASGVSCPRCGKKIGENVIKDSIVKQLQGARQKMWQEKRHLSDFAQYELLGVLIDAFSATDAAQPVGRALDG